MVSLHYDLHFRYINNKVQTGWNLLYFAIYTKEESIIQYLLDQGVSPLERSNVYINNYLTTEEFRPAIKDERYTLFKELLPESVAETSVNSMLDNYYSNYQEQMIINAEKSRLLAIVNPMLKKVVNSIDKISALLKKRDNTDKYKLYGELLTANLYKKCDFAKYTSYPK